ncbi:MAG: hypothetical protein LIP12_00080 [Clostridiales bacterium]|nr:hypothetical protein [Clostridiales bacterium]
MKLQDLVLPVAIHCKNEKEAEIFCNHLSEIGRSAGYVIQFMEYEENLCYYIEDNVYGNILYGDVETAKEEGLKIVEFSDLDYEKPVTYKYGQMLISNQDTEIENFPGIVFKIHKGNRVVVGFDGLAHHMESGYAQPFEDGISIEGYSHTGVVAMVWKYLNQYLPMEKMLEDYGLKPKDITDVIKKALAEIGLHE